MQLSCVSRYRGVWKISGIITKLHEREKNIFSMAAFDPWHWIGAFSLIIAGSVFCFQVQGEKGKKIRTILCQFQLSEFEVRNNSGTSFMKYVLSDIMTSILSNWANRWLRCYVILLRMKTGLQNISASWFLLTHICWKVHSWLHANSALNHKTMAGFNASAILKLNEPQYSLASCMRTQSKTEEISKRKWCTHCIQCELQEIISEYVIYDLHLSFIGLCQKLIWEKK